MSKHKKRDRNQRVADPATFANQTPFRAVERTYKSKDRPLDLSQVLDWTRLDDGDWRSRTFRVRLRSQPVSQSRNDEETYGIMVRGVPGFMLIPNAVPHSLQRTLVKRSYTEYARPPNQCNLSAHYHLPAQSLWQAAQRSQADVPLKDAQETSHLYEGSDNPTPPIHLKPLPASELVSRLRWYTLGMQYDWKIKEYAVGEATPFPADLRQLVRTVADAVQECWATDADTDATANHGTRYPGSQFEPQAGVVNFYSTRDTLMGHVDRSEVNMDAPLISLSLGSQCVFLMGGVDRDTAPIPVLLRSGDIVVMFGESRRAFHGVPRVIENTVPSWMTSDADPADPEWAAFGKHMEQGYRININVRQVV
ncbi:hypothetical protein RI367_002706 [Sorochytrium milnesiophthora]